MATPTHIHLAWTPQATGTPTAPVTFTVYRNMNVIASGLTVPSYDDPFSGLAAGEAYSYDVTETQNGVESAPSNVASATVPFPTPAAPIDLVATLA